LDWLNAGKAGVAAMSADEIIPDGQAPHLISLSFLCFCGEGCLGPVYGPDLRSALPEKFFSQTRKKTLTSVGYLYNLLVIEPMSYTEASSDRLDATFAALADPTRRAILARLASGDAAVNDLAKPFAMSQPAISKHLRVLERAGLISRGRDAQRRPRRIEAQPLAEASDWLENYRKFWEGSFQRLDDLLDELKSLSKDPLSKDSLSKNKDGQGRKRSSRPRDYSGRQSAPGENHKKGAPSSPDGRSTKHPGEGDA